MAASPSGMKDYAIEVASPARDGDRMLALWRSSLDYGDRAQGKFDWYYRRNPEGPPLVVFLLHGAAHEAIGVAATGTRRMKYGERTIPAGVMVDFGVMEAHRTLFPALFLQKAICRQALEDHALLYGIPNPKSLAVIRRAGYRPIGAFVRRVRVLRVARYLSRHVPEFLGRLIGALADPLLLLPCWIRALAARGYGTAWIERPDERFDDLWARALPPGTLVGVRDRRFLAWRFGDYPFRPHRFFTVISPDGRLSAYAACESNGRVLQVRDFLADPAQPGAWKRLWADLAIAAHREGHDSLVVEFLGSAKIQRRLADAGLIARERGPVHAVLPEAFAELADEERWYLTNADDDN